LYLQQLSEVPELASYGPVFRSSPAPIPLTESETEYVITAVKHIYKEHVVFQFNVRNTLPDTILEQVSVVMAPTPETELAEDFIIPVPSLATGADGVIYVSFTRTDPSTYASGSFTNALKFVSKEVDPASGEPEEEGYEDEYQLEELDFGAGDYMVPSYANFASEWDRLKSGANLTETFALSALESLKGGSRRLLRVCVHNVVPHSRMRFARRDPQHGTARRHPNARLALGAHAQLVGHRGGRRRQGACPGADDLCLGHGRDAGAGCAGRAGGGGKAGPQCGDVVKRKFLGMAWHGNDFF
jgi:hypothetical protein